MEFPDDFAQFASDTSSSFDEYKQVLGVAPASDWIDSVLRESKSAQGLAVPNRARRRPADQFRRPKLSVPQVNIEGRGPPRN